MQLTGLRGTCSPARCMYIFVPGVEDPIKCNQVESAAEINIQLYDWNANGEDELVGSGTIQHGEIVKLLSGVIGATTTLDLELLSPEGMPIVGNDKKNATVSCVCARAHASAIVYIRRRGGG